VIRSTLLVVLVLVSLIAPPLEGPSIG